MTWSLPPIPSHWVSTTLDQIADVQGGITLGKKRKPDEKLRLVPYLRVANVQRGRLDLREVKEVEATEDEIRALRLQQGDLLMNEGGDRDKLGRGWVWNGEIDECIHQNHVFRIRLQSESISPEYLSHFANTVGADYFSYAGKHTTGLASINRTKLCALPVALPPAKEQRRIVESLQELGARTAAVRSALDAIPPLLDRFRQSVLAAAFRGELTADWREENPDVEPTFEMLARTGRSRPVADWREEAAAIASERKLPALPEKWCWATVGSLADHEIQTGPFGALLHRSEFVPSGVPVVAIGNVKWGHLEMDDCDFVAGHKAEQLSAYQIQTGDVLFTRTGTVGRSALVPKEFEGAVMSSHILRVRLNQERYRAEVLFRAFRGEPTIGEQLSDSSRGMTRPGFNTTLLASLTVPVPPIQEQDAILKRLIKVDDWIKSVEAEVLKAATQLDVLHQSVLSRAFRGELVPQDPDDEPASVLLERIRAEREAAGTNGKPGRGRRKA